MLPELEIFGHTIHMGQLFLFINYFVSVPLTLILIRKRYGYTLKKAILYSLLTLGLGVAALHITSALANAIFTHISQGEFVPYETTSSYGIITFMTPMFLLYCLLFRDSFRTLNDYTAPAVSTVQVIGKLVCFFDGCCKGKEDPNGLYFQSLGYRAIPVQLYDTINNAFILLILLILTYTFSKKHKGYLMPIGGMLYAIEKGILEEFRVYNNEWEGNFLGTGRTYWQYFLLVLFIGCLIWLIGAIIWEKKGKPDFDTATNIRLPDFSKIRLFKNNDKGTSKTKTNAKTSKGNQNKKHKK